MSSGIGLIIKKLREKRGWSLRELESRTGINYSVLSRIESGKRPVTDQEVNVFADLFDVSTDYLHGRTNTPDPLKHDGMEDAYRNEEFLKFANDPELQRWFKELPKSKEEDIRKLYKMWKIIQSEED